MLFSNKLPLTLLFVDLYNYVDPNSAECRLEIDVVPSRNLPVTTTDKFKAFMSPAKKRNAERNEKTPTLQV